MTENVILVDEADSEIGVGEKLAVHREGTLHRAFSIFIFNSEGQMLLQQREENKYHSGGLWTNACCSHPRPGESTEQAARRRLWEEMGFECDLDKILHFTYRAAFDNGLIEHEYDHVYVGIFDDEPAPNPEEVAAWKWIDVDSLREDVEENPDHYTPWFRIIFDRVISHVQL